MCSSDLRRTRLVALARQLDVLSPLAVLDRGYAIVSKDGAAITDASVLASGDVLDVRFAKGATEVLVRGRT